MDIEEIRKEKIELSNLILSRILKFKEETSLRVEEIKIDWVKIGELGDAQEDFALGSIELTLGGI